MAVSQPLSTDKLSAPNHSLMHRIIATDPSAAVESVEVDSGGNLVLAHPLATGQGGTGKTANANAANGVVVNDGFGYLVGDGRNLTNLPAQTPGAASITTTMLKTATSEVSSTGSPQAIAVTGGQYCFLPQYKHSAPNGNSFVFEGMGSGGYGIADTYLTTSYTGPWITFYGSNSELLYAIVRYVTSSGQDYWLFLLVDKSIKEILAMSGAPDAPAYGNSNDFDKQPHPFPSYNPATQEIILIEKSQAKAIQQEAKDKELSVLELVDKDYKIDFTKIYPYVPIHSGQFSPDKEAVLVNSIPDYIQIRKLILATDADKQLKKANQAQKQADYEMKKAQDDQKKQAILDKLGITKEEAKLIIG